MRRFLLAAALAGMVAMVGAPGLASASGSTDLCDTQKSVCVSMDGTSGHFVYGKTAAGTNSQITSVSAVAVCSKDGAANEYVQYKGFHGDTENCPFTVPALDGMFAGYQIVEILGDNGNVFAQGISSTGDIDQSSGPGSGLYWVRTPGNQYVNVLVSDAQGTPATPEYMATNGAAGDQLYLGSGGSKVFTTWTFQSPP